MRRVVVTGPWSLGQSASRAIDGPRYGVPARGAS